MLIYSLKVVCFKDTSHYLMISTLKFAVAYLSENLENTQSKLTSAMKHIYNETMVNYCVPEYPCTYDIT